MVNEKVRRPSGKRFIKNNQQCARYGHLEMAGRDWFLRSPLFPDQRIITQILGIHGEGDQTEGEHSFKQRTILQITVNGGWNVKKKKKRNHDLQDRNFCKVSPSLYLRTFGAFCHVERKKYRASSGGCREAAWAECQSQALAVPRSRLESRRTASEAAYLKSLASKIPATRTFLFFPPPKTKKQNTF